MNFPPSTTFVMAAHNAAETIHEAIESVVMQSIADWSLIVVDDASTDETCDVVEPFLADDRIFLRRLKTNQGSARARNLAIQEIGSTYFAVMDADDISLPHRLELSTRWLQQHPEAVAVAGQVEEFGAWGGPEVSVWPTDPIKIQRRQQQRRMPLPHPSTTFRTEAVRAVGGYDDICRRAQDYALFLRLGQRPLYCLDDVLLRYRTIRPLPLSYAIQSGRFGALARLRNNPGERNEEEARTSLGAVRTWTADLKSLRTWSYRRLLEQH